MWQRNELRCHIKAPERPMRAALNARGQPYALAPKPIINS